MRRLGLRGPVPGFGALLAIFWLAPGPEPTGPYDMPLAPGAAAPSAEGSARLQFADSPFGVAATADGRLSYDIRITASGLPDPATLGAYRAYVAWDVATDLSDWQRLGAVRNGTSVVGQAQRNKFLLVITAEADTLATVHTGPTVLHGASPSTWLQRFLTHPLFRGISQ
jgi:hypothetical protein